MAKPGLTGLTRVIKAFGYSLQGFRACWRHEAAFRQELLLCLAMTPLAFYIGADLAETALLLSVLVLVLLMELLNSAVEAVVDRVGSEQHELSGRAKDMASAAVLLSLLLLVSVWGLLLTKNWPL